MDKIQALSKAMGLCSRQEFSESGIRSKLEFWETAPADIESIISRLTEEKFIDDQRYANAYVKDKVRLNQWGRIKIRYMLSMEKVSHAIIEQAITEIDEELYADALQDLLIKKARNLKSESNPFTKRQKLIKFGQSRGFEVELILRQIKDLT
jgi:regulatory protein